MDSRIQLVGLVAIGLILGACSSAGADETAPRMSAQDGDLVEVHYVGTLDDGSGFDSSRERGEALAVTLGAGDVIAGFDAAIQGLAVGEVVTVRIDVGDAYGEPSDEYIMELPVGEDQGDVAVGDVVYLTTGASAVVLEIRETTVIVDANHPLAGEALTFEIEVVSITRP